MNSRYRTPAWSVVLAAIVAAVSVGVSQVGSLARQGAAPSSNIREYAPSKLDDFTAIVHVTYRNDDALRKISKDFGLAYRLQGDVTLKYKEENKFRMDGRVGASKATFIVNGRTQYAKLSVGVRMKTDLGTEPGKRKSLLDVGLVSPSYLAYANATFLGVRPFEGHPCAVYELKYKEFNLDTSRRVIYVDPRFKVIVKREEYNQGDQGANTKLRATYFYRDPKEVRPGLWFPTRIEVKNAEGERAGEMVYKDFAVNVGLDDSVFAM